ncbi:MAG: hypothetical protein KGZ42_04200, partial [Melioribacter sp.]|nr:hypothetical protein [Melioribacter sp.]
KNIHIYKTGLSGRHQFHNSALAVKVLYELLNISDISIINKGLMNVVANTGIQGRYEIINDRPRVIFDAAHNPEGIASFISEFSKEYIKYPNRVLIFGAMKDKDIVTMLKKLKPYFNTFYAVQPGFDRAVTVEELVEIGKGNGIQLLQLKDYNRVIENFVKGETGDCLVVLGSIYLLGEIKSKMIKKKLDK